MLTLKEIDDFIVSTDHYMKMKERLDNPPITALLRYLTKSPASERHEVREAKRGGR